MAPIDPIFSGFPCSFPALSPGRSAGSTSQRPSLSSPTPRSGTIRALATANRSPSIWRSMNTLCQLHEELSDLALDAINDDFKVDEIWVVGKGRGGGW